VGFKSQNTLNTGGSGVQSIVAGANISVDNTDPANPVVSSTTDDITVVANYSALPSPATVTGQFYWASASEGTRWLPGSFGGTYYSAGMYHSNGVTWEFMDVPYQASQATVNTGTNTDQFLTPSTFTNSTQLAGKQPVGNYITVLTGDGTATGPGSAVFTLATVLSALTKGSASKTVTVTTDAKGRVTALSDQDILITESQVANLTADLAAKQSTTLTNTHILVGNGSSVATDVALSGDATLSNTGALTLASTIVAATKGAVDKTLTISYDAKGRLTVVSENTISITSTNVTDFNEAAQDAVGGILTDSTTIDLTYSDAGNTITAIVIDDSITNAKLANMATQTFKGRTTAGTGDPEDLTKAQAQAILGLSTTSVDNAIIRYDGTTGAQQTSLLSIDDNGGLIATGVAGSTYTARKIEYDTTLNQWIFYDNDSATALNVGYESWFTCLNNTGSTIPNGSVVYISGASGGVPTIALAQANAAATTVAIGIATEAILNGTTGKVTQTGLVNGVNTSALTAGAVYVSSTVAGGLTNTAPLSPNYRMRVGFVGVINATTGTILVTPSTAALGNGTTGQVLGISGTTQAFLNANQISGYQGYPLMGQLATTVQAPGDAATYFLGSTPRNALTTTGGTTRLYVPKGGTITSAYVFFTQAAGSAETSSVFIRLNNTTDTLISAAVVNNATQTFASGTGLGITVVAGDYIEFKWVTPTWATNPSSSLAAGIAYIE
jgi:hypothetical protein